MGGILFRIYENMVKRNDETCVPEWAKRGWGIKRQEQTKTKKKSVDDRKEILDLPEFQSVDKRASFTARKRGWYSVIARESKRA